MRRILFFLLYFLISSIITAQEYQFKKYGIEEGILSNDTYDILQDRNNRIWITTNNGVSCFNGTTFKNYTTESGLAANLNFSLFEDSKGRIWVGSLRDGPSIIENGKARSFDGLDYGKLGSINDFLEDKDGTIYLFTTTGIVQYKNNSFSIKAQSTSENDFSSIQQAAWYDDNNIFMVSTKVGLLKMTLEPFKIEKIHGPESGMNRICYSLDIDQEKNIWVGAYGGLYKVSGKDVKYYPFNPEEFDLNRVYDILQENENELYLCFEGNGLGIFNKKTESLELINEKQGLPSKYLYHMIKDTEGNHWMTSYGEGLIHFRGKSFKYYDDNHGMPSKSVSTVAEWNDKIMLGTEDGIAVITENKVSEIILKGIPISNLTTSSDGNLLIATNTNIIKLHSDGEKKVIDEGVYELIYENKNETLLLATDMIKAISKDSIIEKSFHRAIGMVPIADRHVVVRVLGLSQFKDYKDDSIPGLKSTIHTNFRSADVIDENQIIAGSTTKLYHIVFKNEKIHFKTFDLSRFKDLRQFRALKIDGNDLWLAGRNMFSKIDLKLLLDKDSIVGKNYKYDKSFMGSEIHFNSFLITKNKTVVAPSFTGLLTFKEEDYLLNTQAPKLDLQDVYLFSEPFQDSLYRTSNGIVLPHQKNYLSFKMEAITFTNPENVLYKYRMLGLRQGNKWSLPTRENHAVFSYLPPGNYTFEFKADNGDGVWTLEPYQYSFKIAVPFWRTWIFWFFSLFFTAASALLYYYYQNKRERKRNQEFTHSLIKAQEDERIRVARDLHDSVGQKLMLLTKKTKDLGNLEMESLSTNTLEELRSISRGLHPSTLEKLGPTGAIQALIDEVDENTDIFFTHDIEDINSLLSPQAALHLYRIIQEALNNIVKHAEAKAVTVSIKKDASSIQANIKDNGKGFEYSERLTASVSLGMKTLAERAKILNSKIEIKSFPNSGTIISLIIPT